MASSPANTLTVIIAFLAKFVGLGNVPEMLKDFDTYLGRSTEGLQGFIDEMLLRNEREEEKDELKGDGVTLITLHAAKGLEFPNVYLIGVEEGVLPHGVHAAGGKVVTVGGG